jgi:hypothetical protein
MWMVDGALAIILTSSTVAVTISLLLAKGYAEKWH